ncbi:SDR family NAD(P)-dependent oxidoreductase [Bacillus subtilis]|nr:SDR family NAD(P)-dependent oxidoreductase [Pseudomonas sp. A29(2023)]MDL5592071.1 SDR family NAD(P)-dependent oxidoreductase [Bacillus subtilis]
MQIENKVFIVTGGASGLGAATAELLVSAGAKVMLVDMNADAVAAQAQRLGAQSVVADISNEAAAEAAVQATVKAFGSLNGLVNCAGIVRGEKILGKNGPHALASFAQVINVNLIGSFNMLRLAAAAIAESEANANADGERGVIINTASVAAFDGQIGQAAYSASKGAIASLTLPAARELARFGIRVMTIAPGIFETPMMAGMTPEVRDSLAAGVPFPPRLGKPAEYAALVRHIIENSMLNGEVIRLDGALRMAAK